MYQFMFPHWQDTCHQVWLKSNDNCRRVKAKVLKFPAPYGPVIRKISQSNKKFNSWQTPRKVTTCIVPMVTNVLVNAC